MSPSQLVKRATRRCRIAAESNFYLASFIQVFAWGNNSLGQLGLNDTANRRAPAPVEALWAIPVAQLAAGDAHSAALTINGFLFTWGHNEKGQLGLAAGADAVAQVCHFGIYPATFPL